MRCFWSCICLAPNTIIERAQVRLHQALTWKEIIRKELGPDGHILN